jgi:hypothetical protein
MTATTNNIAVAPLIVAYIGGKISRDGTFGIRTLDKTATTIGIKMDTAIIILLYFLFILSFIF